MERLLSQLIKYADASSPVHIRRAYRSITLEVIYAYCFGSHEDYISSPDFAHKFVLDQETTGPLFNTVVNFPWLFDFIILITNIASRFKPNTGALRGSYNRLKDTVDEVVAHPELLDKEQHETVYHHLLADYLDNGGVPKLSKKQLWEESITLIAAGTETVAITLTVGTFYILNDPSICGRLVDELRLAWPDLETQASLETLEKLPYLVSVMLATM